jgi:transcriptional regulator with XRE-family HTH domain
MIDDDIRRVARLLEALVKVEKVSVRELERRLELGGGTLNRIFSGRNELKLRHILLVLGALGIDPDEFFQLAFQDLDPGEEMGTAWVREAVHRLLVRRARAPRRKAPARFPGLDRDSRREEVRRVVVEVLGELGLLPPPF